MPKVYTWLDIQLALQLDSTPIAGFHLENLVWGEAMGEQSEPGIFLDQTTPTLANTPTFRIHKLLEVVHSMLTIAVFLIMHSADHSSIPNSLPHGKKT